MKWLKFLKTLDTILWVHKVSKAPKNFGHSSLGYQNVLKFQRTLNTILWVTKVSKAPKNFGHYSFGY